jgi:hypothetical protein
LGSGDFVSGYSYHMSVRTRLSDHTKQTKFQSQWPNDVETPVPSIWVQKCSNIGTVSTWMGDRLEWYPPSRKNADCSCWAPVLYHIVRNWSNALHHTRIVESSGRPYVCCERTTVHERGWAPAEVLNSSGAAQDVLTGLQPRRRAKVQIWIDPESPRG